LARLGLAYERHARQPDGDALDVEALIDFAVLRAAGEPDDERFYEARLRTAHDLGVLVLLDASGSTEEKTSSGRAIWDEQRQLVANLGAGFEEVGARVAAYGFNSQGRHIRFLRIKDFDDRFDQRARSRLGGMKPAGLTRLGVAVRHGTSLISTKAGTSNRLLVLVSDGFPYENDYYQGPYAEHDTRRALDEAVKSGVGCACISVASSTDQEALERLWGNMPHKSLVEAEELGRYAASLFRQALRLPHRISKD
jgi:nitric oxide reductase activation protein